jgi:hypothetical protein
MNLFQSMLARKKSDAVDSDHLPEVNAFVDVATGGKTESLPVEDIGPTSFQIRSPGNAAVGAKALFNYSNGRGRFRFHAQCEAINNQLATYAKPAEITVIEKFGDKRRNFRLKHALPVVWRYAPEGVGYGEFAKSTTADISCVGVSLVVPRELKPGTQIELKLDLNGSAKPFAVIGALTRPTQKQSSGKFSAGLSFQNISPTNQNAIGEFITSRQNGQRNRSLADQA